MPQVLLVDDDPDLLVTFSRLLITHGYAVSTASDGLCGLKIALERQPEVAIIDCRLPDISGLDVLGRLRDIAPNTACVLLSGFLDIQTEFEATRRGACACLAKPIVGEEVVKIVEQALACGSTKPTRMSMDAAVCAFRPTRPHACGRLAEKLVAFIESPEDTPTLKRFGRAVGISAGGFRNWCRVAGLRPRRVLLFGRGLRATVRQQVTSLGPNDLLDIVDSRSLRKFLRNCAGSGDRLPSTVGQFLDQQQFIQDSRAIAAIRHVLEASGLSKPQRS